jgi:hypothetical protein
VSDQQSTAGALEDILDTLRAQDERLDDQYDRVSAIDHTLMAVDTKLGALPAQLGSLEEAVLTLAETLLRPAARAAFAAREGTRG